MLAHVSTPACEPAVQQLAKQAHGQHFATQSAALQTDSPEPRTPDNEQPALSRQRADSPSSMKSAAPGAAAQGATGVPKATSRRAYEKWTDSEEDLFFVVLKSNAGCLPNVVCGAAAKRIGTKDYTQTRSYYGRLVKRLDTALTPEAQLSVHEDLRVLHRAMLIYWNHWVSKAPQGGHGSDAFRSMLNKPRKMKDFHAAVQQGVSRLLQQASKIRPSVAALTAAAAAPARRASPAKPARQPPADAARQPLAVAGSANCHASTGAQPPAQLAGPASTAVPAAAAATQPVQAATSSAAAVPGQPGAAATLGTAPAAVTIGPAAAAAHSVTPPKPPRLLTAQMLPLGAAAQARVEAAGPNPYLELANLKSSKSAAFLMGHLQTKWGSAQPPLLRVAHVSSAGRPAAWAAPDALMGQLFMEAGQPDPFQLNYAWPDDPEARQAAPQQVQQADVQRQPPAKRTLDTAQTPPAKRAAVADACAAARVAPRGPAAVTLGASSALAASQLAAAPSQLTIAPGMPPQPVAPQTEPASVPAGGDSTPTTSAAPAQPSLPAAAQVSQPAGREDSLFGMAWPPPSLLVTPSLMGPPSQPAPSSQPVQQLIGGSQPQPLAAPATPANASLPAGSQPPAAATFQALFPGNGAPASAALPATRDPTAAEHSNWGGSLAGLLGGPRVNEFGLEESCDAFAAGWGRSKPPPSKTGAAAAPQAAAGAHATPPPLRYFADLADSRPPHSAGSRPAAGQRPPERTGSLHDALAAQRDQGGSGNADMAGILERLLGAEEASNLALPPSLLGVAALPLGCGAGSAGASASAAASPAGAAPRQAAVPAAAAAADRDAASAGTRSDAKPAAGPSDRQEAGVVATGAFGGGSLLGGEALSQLAMDVGSLLGLGDAFGADNSWDAPPRNMLAGGGSSDGSGSASGSQGSGLKPFHELFPSTGVAV